MRSLLTVLFAVAFTSVAHSQSNSRSVLTGTLYDANGAVIARANVTATNAKGETFETITSEEGIYILTLPFSKYDIKATNFKEAKYDIVAYSPGFVRSVTKGFVFVPAFSGKMQLDIALEVGPCDDCHRIVANPLKPE